MPNGNDKRLYDITTRMQGYVEGVKAMQAIEFDAVLSELSKELKRIFSEVPYKNVGDMTRRELRLLVIELRKSQSKIYSVYTKRLIGQIEQFMAATLEVNRKIYAYSISDKPEEIPSDKKAIDAIEEENGALGLAALFGLAAITGTNSRLWAAIEGLPMPSNGQYLADFIKAFSISSQAAIESALRKSWANKEELSVLLEALVGTSAKQAPASILQKISMHAKSVIATAMQHTAVVTSAAVMSAIHGKYRWYSVMDSRTTDICISRNRKVYQFGKGPIPPAHVNCRSHIGPYFGKDGTGGESFLKWVSGQSKEFQADILDKKTANALRKGDLSEADMPKMPAGQPITIEQFKTKASIIING